MPKDIATTGNNLALAPRLPDWLERMCEQQHPDVAWQPPANLPRKVDLMQAIADLERLIHERATPAYAKQCLAQLMVAFEPNTKLSADEVRLRAMVWLEACGDLCDGLWREATQEAIRGCKWMPKPAEFRDLVVHRITDAKRQIDRLRAMLEAHDRPPQAFVREPYEVRTRGLRDSFKRVGDITKAARYERDLALHEQREVEEWARNV